MGEREMEIGSYVLVTNKDCNLYRRRSKVVRKFVDNGTTYFELYSEGLEESEIVPATDCEAAKF